MWWEKKFYLSRLKLKIEKKVSTCQRETIDAGSKNLFEGDNWEDFDVEIISIFQ